MKNYDLTNNLISDMPANSWELCYLLGNGNIGVAANGNPAIETVYLNDDRLWSGYCHDKHAKTSEKDLQNIRSLLQAGKIKKCEKLIKKTLLGEQSDVYLPLARLAIISGHDNFSNYSRTLSLEGSVQNVEYDCGDNKIVRQSFVSYPLSAMCMKISSACFQSLEIALSSDVKSQTTANANCNLGELLLTGTAPSKMKHTSYHDNPITYDTSKKTNNFACCILVKGDNVCVDNNHICANGKDIYIYAISAVNNDFEAVMQEIKRKKSAVMAANYSVELIKHIDDCKKLYHSSSLKINDKRQIACKTTYDLIVGYSHSATLDNLLFNVAKYLSIAGSRRGTMAMNLQGIWSKDLRPAWNCNYTLNINTQMNYWVQDAMNISECFEPYVDLVKAIAKKGALIADETFHCRGIACGHNSDGNFNAQLVGAESPYFPVRSSMFVGAMGWLCYGLYDHYLYSENLDYLKEIFPLLKDASLFYLDYMTWDDKKSCYLISPSTSPENFYKKGLGIGHVSVNATMESAIAKSVMEAAIKASEILNIDDGIIKEIACKLPKIAPYTLTKDGKLSEWAENFKEGEVLHRHLSPLYGLHPYNDICFVNNDIKQGAINLLKSRGIDGTGWSIAWKSLFYARLGMAKEAYIALKKLLAYTSTDNTRHTAGVYASMLTTHPPFQIDANFGGAAAIIEMLYQSHEGYIKLLPALPENWNSGEIVHMRARGGYIIDMQFNSAKVEKLVVYHASKPTCKVYYNGEMHIVQTIKM